MAYELVLTIPRQIDLFGARGALCHVLNTIAQEVFVSRRGVLLKFDEVQLLKPSGLLCLAATIQAADKFLGKEAINGTYPRARKVERALQDAGFFTLLGVPHRLPETTSGAPTEWIRPITHNKSDGSQVELLKQRVFGLASSLNETSLSRVYVGLTEAMTNVVQHAYTIVDGTPKVEFIHNRWWITGKIDRQRRVFTFVICDLGIGIPKTIESKSSPDALRRVLRFEHDQSYGDGNLIQLAMLLGESRTELPWRGKGLPEMRKVVDDIGGQIRIASGFATCTYARRNYALETHPSPFVGTLVEWNVPLDSLVRHGDSAYVE